jgi:autotransporter-associated beta strand protein
LRFGGTGGYTSTNDLNLSSNGDRFKVNRIILNATAGTSTIASNGSNILQFDTTIGVTPLIRQDGAGGFNISHPIELTASNLELGGDGGGIVDLSGPITGNGGLSKIGTSTFVLSGSIANSFTGATTVSGGTLLLNKTPTADAIDQNLTIATGGTVVLGNEHQLQADGTGGRKVTLSGGTLSTGATAGFSDVVGLFEMTASSTIDLGGGDHELRFLGITGTSAGTLSVLDWAGTGNDFGLEGRVVFSGMGNTPNTDFASFLSTVQFENFGTGGVFLFTGQSGVYELVPVPEPVTVLAIAFGSLAAGSVFRRRLKKSPVNGPHLSV